MPLVIVGGGRWGRTWLSVVVAARGNADGVVLAARSQPEEVRQWARTRPELAGLTIVSDLAGALAGERPPQAAIISSRPRDHLRDGIEAFGLGLHALIEKPLGVDVESGERLLAASQRAGRVLTVGTEFAYLPAFHCLAERFAGAGSVDLSLTWDDIDLEERYGSVKIRHEEIDLLGDLFPHAYSILRVFVPDTGLRISAAQQSSDGRSAQIEFRDGGGGRHEFRCDVRAKARCRRLEIRSASGRAAVDFGDPQPQLTIDGVAFALDPQLAAMTSTLRLELGAFLSRATGVAHAAFTGLEASDLLSAEAELRRVLAGAAR